MRKPDGSMVGMPQQDPRTPNGNEPTKHPVIAALGLVTTGALVAAVVAALAKGFSSLK